MKYALRYDSIWPPYRSETAPSDDRKLVMCNHSQSCELMHYKLQFHGHSNVFCLYPEYFHNFVP